MGLKSRVDRRLSVRTRRKSSMRLSLTGGHVDCRTSVRHSGMLRQRGWVDGYQIFPGSKWRVFERSGRGRNVGPTLGLGRLTDVNVSDALNQLRVGATHRRERF